MNNKGLTNNLDTSFRLLFLAKHLKNSGVKFNLYSCGHEVESDVNVMSYKYNRESIILTLSTNNSYEILVSEIDKIGCDAVYIEDSELEKFQESMESLKKEKPLGIFIRTFEEMHNNYGIYAWNFTALRY